MSAHRPEVGATGAPIAWAAAAGLLGLLPGPAGWADAVLVLAWLSLLAPAAGLAAGVSAKSGLLRALLRHLLPLGAWGLVLAFALAAGPRMPPTPLAALGVVAGLYLGGLGLGRLLPAGTRSATAAGAGLLLALVLAGGPRLGGLGGEGQSLARTHPTATRLLLDAAPDGLVLEAAGLDWAHANPGVYASSGVEWYPRRPRSGGGTALAAVACGAGLLLLSGLRGAKR